MFRGLEFAVKRFLAKSLSGELSSSVHFPHHPFLCAGELISGWSVYNFELDDVTNLPEAEDAPEAATARRLLQGGHLQDDAPAPPEPTFYSGTLDISGEDAAMVTNAAGGKHLACTYLDTTGWGKGVAFVNGFNLGW